MKATDQIELEFLKKIKNRLIRLESKYCWIDWFIAPVLCSVILLVIYFIKDVYPFGNNTVAYYDMTTNYIPNYTYTWDVFHGKRNILLNWYSGFATSTISGFATNILFPTNLFLLFTTRDGILFATSFFLMLHVSLCSFTMSLYFKKHFDSTIGTVCAGLLYGFCGFLLQYYTNLFFLNIMILLPLFVWSLERLMYDHKYIMFIIISLFAFTQNIQLVFMLCLYLVFKSYFIYRNVPEEKRGRSLRLLAASLIVTALAVCIIQVPTVLLLSRSSRVGGSAKIDYFTKMRSVFCEFRRQKHFMMYGSEIAVALFILVVLRGKRIISKYADNITMIVLLALPILHEGINLLWHTGSYKHFPMRMGYALTFECLVFVGRYFKDEGFPKVKYISKAARLLGIAIIPFVAFILYGFFKEFIYSGIVDKSPFFSYWIYFLTLSGAYFIVFLMETKESRNVAVIMLVVCQTAIGAYGLIAPIGGNYDIFRTQYTLNAVRLHEEFGDEINYSGRLKADPDQYESNYASIVLQPAIGFWSNAVSSDLENTLKGKMGYDGTNSYVMDSGGTIFTDALLGVTRAAAPENPDEFLFTKDNSKKNVYNSMYTFPFAILTDSPEIRDDNSGLEFSNDAFKDITGIEDELIKIYKAENFVENKRVLNEEERLDVNEIYDSKLPPYMPSFISFDDKYGVYSSMSAEASSASYSSKEKEEEAEKDDSFIVKEYKLKIPVDMASTVYLCKGKDFSGQIKIMIGDKPVFFNSMMTYGDYYYPNDMRNGIVPLGSYENEYADITIYSLSDDLDDIKIGLLDLDILNKGIKAVNDRQSLEISMNKNGMNISGEVEKAGTLFVPIGYSQDWTANVNGMNTVIKPYINNSFVAVDVPKGEINVRLMFKPQGLPLGIFLSITGVLLFLFLYFFEKKGGLQGWKYEALVDKIVKYGYLTIITLFFIIFYIVPIYIKMSL